MYGIQKALAPVTPVTVENGTLTPGNYRYVLMSEKGNYTKGVHALRTKCEKENDCRQPLFIQEDGSRIYRPLTFKENIEAKGIFVSTEPRRREITPERVQRIRERLAHRRTIKGMFKLAELIRQARKGAVKDERKEIRAKRKYLDVHDDIRFWGVAMDIAFERLDIYNPILKEELRPIFFDIARLSPVKKSQAMLKAAQQRLDKVLIRHKLDPVTVRRKIVDAYYELNPRK